MLKELIRACEEQKLTLHSIAVQQQGKLLDAHYIYPKDRPHVLHSLSKSFTAMAAGMAIAEGKLKLTDRMVDFFPEYPNLPLNEYQAAVTVRDLLTMAPGLTHPRLMSDQRVGSPDPNWVRVYLESPQDHMPGTQFHYDTGCTYMVSAILQRVTGETVLDYLKPRLFDPMKMQPVWTTCPMGITLGGAGLYLTTPELVRFGQMLLDEGRWQGQQLVPADWVRACTCKQIENDHPGAPRDNRNGYGYQFWLCHNGAFRADGAACQQTIVWPEKQAVIVITARENNPQALLDAMWELVGSKL